MYRHLILDTKKSTKAEYGALYSYFQVFEKRAIGADEFLGEGTLIPPESTSSDELDVNLYTKPREKETKVRLKGSISLSLFTVDAQNFMDI